MWAAKKALPLTFKWEDNLETKERYAILYNKTAQQYGVDISDVDHQLTVIANLNSDRSTAQEEVREYLKDYITETYPQMDRDEKINCIIEENAVGSHDDYYESIKLAVEKTGSKNILLSFESMADFKGVKEIIDMLNQKIEKNLP